MHQSDRYQTGLDMHQTINGEAGLKLKKLMDEFAPDVADMIIEFAFGTIYPRPGLDLTLKELAVVGALAAMGNARSQLAMHIRGALNVGNTISEVSEVILHVSAYAGFPATLNGLSVLREVLHERLSAGYEDRPGQPPTQVIQTNRREIGAAMLARLNPGQAEILERTYEDLAPGLVDMILEFGYADLYTRDNLSPLQRQIVTIAALAAMGTAEAQLEFHIDAGLNIGLTEVQIREIFILLSVYAGFPVTLNGLMIMNKVLQKRKG